MNIPLRRYFSLLARYLRPEWPRVALQAALLVANIGLQLYNPQLIRRFLDTAMGGGQSHTLGAIAIQFILFAALYQVLAAFARYLGELIGWRATNELRADVSDHCLKLDLSFHKSRTPGEMVERIDGDVTALSNFFSQMMIDFGANLVLMSGVLILLFREDWRAGLAMSLFAGVTLYLLSAIRAITVPLWTKQRQVAAELFGWLSEVLSGTEPIRASGAGAHMLHKFARWIQTIFQVNLRAFMSMGLMWSSSLLIFGVGTAVAFGLGAYLYTTGVATAGTVYLIFHYTELLRRPIEQIRTQMQDLQRAGASISRVEELLQTRTKVADGPGQPLPEGPLSVAFEGVTFAYDPGDPVLSGIDLHLAPGQVLGLLGRTGSGKSTLARLLLRFYDPTDGVVRLGGHDLRATTLKQLRTKVGFVTQDVQLFAAPVRDNLTLFDPSLPDERIIAVLDELGLGPWYRALPNGLDSELESGGGGLSAGEGQLLAFARVFLADPGLVILDEASSRLDPATEALVERAVDRLLTNRTGIIIAHRLATIQRADAILILEDGQILEHGERERLATDPDTRFAQLLRTGIEEVLAS